MAYSVIVPSKTMATNIDSLNASVVSGSYLENGNVFRLDGFSGSTGYGEVFFANVPTAGSLNDLWMALAPEIVVVTAEDGTKYKGINADPRNFRNGIGDVVDAFKPQPGDLIEMSEDAFSGAKSTNTHANSRDGYHDLAWGTAQVADSLCLKYLSTSYLSIGSGSSIGDARLTTYIMQVLAN